MNEHHCKYEADVAVLKRICYDDLPEIRRMVKQIFDRLEGNGRGLKTQVAINEQEIKHIIHSMPTMKKAMTWGTIWGGVSGAITIAAFFAIKSFAG